LNPEKCTFGVPQGKLLGYIITKHGIESNTDNISTFARMGPIKNVKDIQRLMGCLVALNQFMSRLGEHRLPLYKLLKKSVSFCWMEEAQKALITKPLVLAMPEPDKTHLLYIAATTLVINTALVVEWEEHGHVYKVQRSVYYISKVLSNCKTRYNQVQKLLYAILITKRKLLPYLESHPVHVVTSHGVGEIIGNHLAMGMITK
jgi:hypothetical protein